MRCPTDKTRLLKSESNKPLYHCSDCSGIFVSLADTSLENGTSPDGELSTLNCPNDGARLRIQEAEGVVMHICAKCRSVWVDGESQERLFSKLPGWFGKSRDTTAGTIAGGVAIDIVLSMLIG
jgi:hypothetical protein